MWNFLFKTLPTLLAIFKQVKSWLDAYLEKKAEEEAKRAFDAAAEKAKKSKQMNDLDKTFGGGK